MRVFAQIAASASVYFCVTAGAANFTIDTSEDGPMEGFNDPTTVAPAGGNTGTTLGQQRLNVFQAAANQWGQWLESPVTIVVGATFDSLGCSGGGAVLGAANTTHTLVNFSGAPIPNVAYPAALADSLAGSNLSPARPFDISASFNTDPDDSITCDVDWYYGLDDNVPDGDVSLYSVVLHELGHGLGFASLTDTGNDGSFTGAGGFPDPFSSNLLDQQENLFWDEMNDSERFDSARNDPDLVWGGTSVDMDKGNWLGFAPEVAAGSLTFPAIPGLEPNSTVPQGGVTAGVVDGDAVGDGDPCDDGFNAGGALNGQIVILDDGGPTCPPAFAAFFAEFEGAVGMIVVSTAPKGFPDMSFTISNQEVNIPYLGVEMATGAAIGSNATLRISTTALQGERNGQVRMFAPAIHEPGSSVSHWTSDASPDLLMEATSGDLPFNQTDLTVAAFEDVGWSLLTGGVELIFANSFEGN